MLPTNRPPINLVPPTAPLPYGQVTTGAAATAEPATPHTDYNHQPLTVASLEHYVKLEEEERFHVS